MDSVFMLLKFCFFLGLGGRITCGGFFIPLVHPFPVPSTYAWALPSEMEKQTKNKKEKEKKWIL